MISKDWGFSTGIGHWIFHYNAGWEGIATQIKAKSQATITLGDLHLGSNVLERALHITNSNVSQFCIVL